MKAETYSDDLIKSIDAAIKAFNDKVPAHQQRIYKELLVLLKDLKTKNGKILNTVDNLKLIIKVRAKLKSIIATKEYKQDVSDFVDAYDEIGTLQNKYFSSFATKFKPMATLELVKQQSIETTKAYLLEGGVSQQIMPDIDQILLSNITGGGSYAELTEQLRKYITKTDNEGALERYARQITTDSINQYSAAYTANISNHLGLEWYYYSNSLIPTSRPFCVHMRKDMPYFHKSEIPELLKGNINGHKVPLYDKTGLPQGMYEGTNPTSFIVYRGGYNCGHQIVPVPETIVPQSAKNRIKKTA